jgi:hypothetical protein
MTVEITCATVDRQYQLARRRGLPRGFVARLQFFGRRLTPRPTGSSAWRRRCGPCRGRRFLPLEPPRLEELPPLLGATGSFFVGDVRVVAAEIRDAQPELVFTIDREREVAVHRATQRIRQIHSRIPFGEHVVRILRPPVHQPDEARGFRRIASPYTARREIFSAACMYFSINIGETDSTSPLLSKP